MVFFTSRKPSSKSSLFFVPAKLFPGLLLLALALHGSYSLPVNKRQTTEEDSTVDIREQLYLGIGVLIEINTLPREDINIARRIVNNLNTTMLCDMYDFYRDYALSTIQLDTPLHAKANYSAAQCVALKAMQLACQWINSTSGSFASDGCTLTSIARTCFIVRYQRMVTNRLQVLENSTSSDPERDSKWRGCLGCPVTSN